MRRIFTFLLLIPFFSWAQPRVELTPGGFAPVVFAVPAAGDENRMEAVTAWAESYNRQRTDYFERSATSVRIESILENAFFYRNRGEEHAFRIRYGLLVSFAPDNTCKVHFSVKEIYDRDRLLESGLSDYFLSDGRIKSDFADVRPSLEKTANDILTSLYNRLQGL